MTPDSERALPLPSAPPEKIRVGLMIDSMTQPAWVRQLLVDALAIPGVSLELIIVNAAPPEPARGRLRSWWLHRDHLVYAAFLRVDRKRHFHSSTSPHTSVGIDDLLHGVPEIAVVPLQKRFVDRFEAADLERIRGFELDVVLRLGFRILQGEILDVPRYGIWSYHHGDNALSRGGPAGFWEVLENRPLTGAILQVLTSELDGGHVIYSSQTATVRGSVTANQASYYWKTAAFVPRKLRDLGTYGSAALRPLVTIQPYAKRLYTIPRNGEMSLLWIRHTARRIGWKVGEMLHRRQWYLAYRFGPIRQEPDMVFHRFQAVYPPPDRIWADPFVMHRDGRHYVFFEEKRFESGKGHIAVIELTREGLVGSPRVALTTPHHLSYPCVFQWQGQAYMLPESQANGVLTLYRAVDFPLRWEPVAEILAEPVVDATIAEIGGLWWIFAARAGGPELASDELYLYWALTPLGPWTPHRRNPLFSDVRMGRAGGGLFRVGSMWYRPAQDGSRRYGCGLRIMQIVRLSPDEFEEIEIASLAPDWKTGLRGMHTLSSDGGLTVIDIQRSLWRWRR